jgi:hypothetical protein
VKEMLQVLESTFELLKNSGPAGILYLAAALVIIIASFLGEPKSKKVHANQDNYCNHEHNASTTIQLQFS